ncbi:MAG: GTP pyrophosphokinase family protein [Treponema sp.]|jgi:putative GTP pyrophosphokinase|nr:GTP pyrophosphokinase family protein [Treponema sp.]
MGISLDAGLRTIQKDEDMFVEILKKAIDPGQKHMSYYYSALNIIEAKLKVLKEKFSFKHERNPIDTIKTRIKDFESIRRKLCRLGFFTSVDPASIEKIIDENIHDVAGIRVICPFIDDVYLLEDSLLRQDDIAFLERKDYIAKPKESGYRSLHLIIETPVCLQNEKKYIKVEIQLRTVAMDFWASLEHRLLYKKDIGIETVKTISAELRECAETNALLDMKMQSIRDYIDNRPFEIKRKETA